MLTLSRKPGESLTIGGIIKVFITRVRGDRVTVSIDAPNELRIVRSELDEIIVDSNHIPPKEIKHDAGTAANRQDVTPPSTATARTE